jgi:hypothetical protein
MNNYVFRKRVLFRYKYCACNVCFTKSYELDVGYFCDVKCG